MKFTDIPEITQYRSKKVRYWTFVAKHRAKAERTVEAIG